MGTGLHHVYHEILTLWIWCTEHFTCSFALKIKGHKSGNHSPSRTRVPCLLAQAMGPFTAPLWESTLLLSLSISSSPESLPSGPKKYMSSSVKTYVNWACWTLEKTLRLVSQDVWGSLEVFGRRAIWSDSCIKVCWVDLGGEEPGGSPTLILGEVPDFWAPKYQY